ncbi:MAG TPA: sulfotransferase [Elusimicrobiales bacterium]|nr:sulfotransferase [Elusimicrobiales bacterium]
MKSQDPHEYGRRTAAYSKNLAEEQFLFSLNKILRHMPKLPPSACFMPPAELPIIYVVGAPRSGTTLLSQLLSRYLPVGYINNLIARFWARPSVGVMLSNSVLGPAAREEILLQSRHGVCPGAEGPHEFGYFWRYWLKLDNWPNHCLSGRALKTLDSRGLKKALEKELLAYFGAPLVFKNIICGLQAGYLSRLHKKSLFIYIKRDSRVAASSILAARRKRYGSYAAWWSLKPSGYPFQGFRGDPAGEVAAQLEGIERDLSVGLSRPGVRSVSVEYERLCSSPAKVLERVCAAISDLGYVMTPLSSKIPRLTPGHGGKISAGLQRRLREIYL